MLQTILMLGPDRDVKGGISSVINVYFESDLVNKYKIIYIATHIDGSKTRKLFQAVKAVFEFSGLIGRRDIKLVHIHTASRAGFYRKSIFVILSKIFGKKIILHVHGAAFDRFYFLESNYLTKKYIKCVMNLTDRIIALSEAWQKTLIDITGESEKTILIYNPVRFDHSPPQAHHGAVNVLFMGRLDNRKGVYDLISVISEGKLKNNKAKYFFCGDGEVSKVRGLIEEKKLSAFIEVPGWILDKEKYYRQADIYILPSYAEGLPMSVLEATSYRLPIISTKVGGIPEIIDDGVNGFLIEPGDKAALEDRLGRLIEDPQLRKQMGQAAYEKAKDKFDVNIIAKQLDKLYQELSN